MLHSFAVQAFGIEVRAAASSAEALALLQRCVFPSSLRLSAPARTPDLALLLEQKDGRFHLSADGLPISSSSELEPLGIEAVRVIDESVTRKIDPYRAMHAGVVAWGGNALALPGASHAGKSSLVAELLRCGATYYSDEYAVLDAAGFVHPYPRPLLLRNGSPQQSPVPAEECGGQTAIGPARLRWILGVQYRAGSTWSIAPVSQSAGVMMLLQNTPHAWAETPNLVQTVERAVATAACFSGTRGEARDAASEILRLVRSSS